MGAEYASRAHVQCCHGLGGLIWDILQLNSLMYSDARMVFSSRILRPGYAPGAAVACLLLFCISSDQCIGGRIEIS